MINCPRIFGGVTGLQVTESLSPLVSTREQGLLTHTLDLFLLSFKHDKPLFAAENFQFDPYITRAGIFKQNRE